MDKLINKIKLLNSPIVVGLDTSVNLIPSFLKKQAISRFKNTAKAAANAILEFNKQIIDQIFDIVPAIKLQCAFYELFGGEGILALQQTIAYAKNKKMFTIVDGKRNDIASSMEAYSNAYLGESELLDGKHFKPFDCDAITINPYLGTDTIMPIFENCEKFDKCAFVLIKTSNKSSNELQNLKLQNNKLFYEKTAEVCCRFSDYKNSQHGFSKIGAVVGATHPTDLKHLREILPNTFFLVPGFGAQGARLDDLKFAFKNGTGAIINSSRAIIGSWIFEKACEENFAKTARLAVQKMKADLTKIVEN